HRDHHPELPRPDAGRVHPLQELRQDSVPVGLRVAGAAEGRTMGMARLQGVGHMSRLGAGEISKNPGCDPSTVCREPYSDDLVLIGRGARGLFSVSTRLTVMSLTLLALRVLVRFWGQDRHFLAGDTGLEGERAPQRQPQRELASLADLAIDQKI